MAPVRTETTISWAPTVCQALPSDLESSQLPAGSGFWPRATQLVSGGAGMGFEPCRTRHCCPGAAVTSGPEPGQLHSGNLSSHSVAVGSLRSRCRQGWFLPETLRWDLPRLPRGGPSLAFRAVWTHYCGLCLCLPSVLLCPQSPCSFLSWEHSSRDVGPPG